MGRLISTVVEPAETTIETGRQLLDRIIEERNKKVLEETKKNHTDLQISTKSAGKTRGNIVTLFFVYVSIAPVAVCAYFNIAADAKVLEF